MRSSLLRTAPVVLLAVLLTASFWPAADALHAVPSSQAHSGAILYLNRGGVWRMSLATEDRQAFIQLPTGTITHVSRSWDRTRIAYSTDIRGAGLALVESTIVVASA